MTKLWIRLTCDHVVMKEPKETNYELPKLNSWEPCPTCGKKRRINEMASMRREPLRDIVDAAEIDELKRLQPHLTNQECLYVVRRRPYRKAY